MCRIFIKKKKKRLFYVYVSVLTRFVLNLSFRGTIKSYNKKQRRFLSTFSYQIRTRNTVAVHNQSQSSDYTCHEIIHVANKETNGTQRFTKKN